MPDPISGESREDWMARCVPELVEEGNEQDQAVAVCAARWDERSGEETLRSVTVRGGEGTWSFHVRASEEQVQRMRNDGLEVDDVIWEERRADVPDDLKSLLAPLDIKQVEDNGMFEGYASVFGNMDMDGDVIVRGAFKRSLEEQREAGRMPKMLWQHDVREIVGKWMDMHEDERGLRVKGKLIMDTQKGREAYALMKEGVLDGMSIGFNVREASPNEEMRRGRVIDEVDLWEVSLVTWGSNPEARVTGVKTARKSVRDFERFLRDAGFSRTEAVALAGHGFKGLEERRDAVDSDATTAGVYESLRTVTALMKG